MRFNKLSASDIRLFLANSVAFEELVEEVNNGIKANPSSFFPDNCIRPFWCRYYEMPIHEHITRVAGTFCMQDELSGFGSTSEHIKATAELLGYIGNVEESCLAEMAREINDGVVDKNNAILALAHGTSLQRTFRCLLIYGCYLNELITLVSAGGKHADKALFCAVRIDPTVVGCSAVMGRISQAVMQSDEKFMKNLRNAMSGKLGKQDEMNAQKRRLVLQILHEEGALKLSDDDLYELFVTELGIYDTHMKDGLEKSDAARSLRQMAYRFIREKSST
ncbi:MAG: hypothetical protein H6R04_803 [Burkholderiaceae bacterium]|nr:hypothetical protein [Burkholderiaceae bacterium]